MLRSMLTLTLLAAGTAHAGSLSLRVTDRDGKPAPDVVVLVVPAASTAVPQPPAALVLIEQRDLAFVPYVTVIGAGTTVRFVNKDPYDHHVRSVPAGPFGAVAPAKSFELRLAADGKGASQADVKFEASGMLGLGCHLHGSMRAHMFVADTPWFARTDANGQAQIDGVPDGTAELRLWHPEQLTEQPARPVQFGAAPLAVEAPLNFTPRRKRRS